LPDDSKVIILSDSDEEEEKVCEEEAAEANVTPSSAARIPASTASTADADEAPKGMQDDNSGGCTPDRDADGGRNGGGVLQGELQQVCTATPQFLL
jgi:hypothetical protein